MPLLWCALAVDAVAVRRPVRASLALAAVGVLGLLAVLAPLVRR